MPYSETKVNVGCLDHIPIIIVIFNFIQKKFEARALSNTAS